MGVFNVLEWKGLILPSGAINSTCQVAIMEVLIEIATEGDVCYFGVVSFLSTSPGSQWCIKVL